MWVTTSVGQLLLVDVAGNRVSRAISIGNGAAGVAVGGGSVWVANTPEATVSRFDPGSGSVTKINVGRIIGIVMWRNCLTAPAPSSSADS